MSSASSGVSGAGLITIVQPGEQRRCELRHGHELRHVPRHDRGDHADRLVADDHVGAEHTVARLLPWEGLARCSMKLFSIIHGGGAWPEMSRT